MYNRQTLIKGTVQIEKNADGWKFGGSGDLAFFTVAIFGAVALGFIYMKVGHKKAKSIFRRRK